MNPELTASTGFKIVAVHPKINLIDKESIHKLTQSQTSRKAQWLGMDVSNIGQAGQTLHMLSTNSFGQLYFEQAELWMKQQRFIDNRPSLVMFAPVSEFQLGRSNINNYVMYSKGVVQKKKELLYKTYKSDPRLVKSTLELQNFKFTESHDWNFLWIGSVGKPYLYENLNEYQRINHFPNSNEITRKDKMCISIVQMQNKFGKQEFNFVPETFVFPEEFADFYKFYQQNRDNIWIVKPASSSRGRGIFLAKSIDDIPIDENYVVSRYINNPLLINQLKFDLRIYVLVTSFDPLKIFVYSEGLTRFATEQYSAEFKKNKFMHLTNYSINKKSDKFVQNKDLRRDDIGSKWSLSALCKTLEGFGADMNFLWSQIYDLIIKSLISIETIVVDSLKRLGVNRNNCFELFGFDVLIDDTLKPWLLEINLSPSLATDSPLDHQIKSNLISDMLNLIGIRSFDRQKESYNKIRQRIRAKSYGQQQQANTINLHKIQQVSQTQRFKEILRDLFEEDKRKGNFIKIFPSKDSNIYDRFFQFPRLINQTVYHQIYVSMLGLDTPIIKQPIVAWEDQPQQIEKAEKSGFHHLQYGIPPVCYECKVQIEDKSTMLCLKCNTIEKYSKKVIITGDDILIEYITRIHSLIKVIREDFLRIQWKRQLENFIMHQIWQTNDFKRGEPYKLKYRLKNRLIEMKERRRRVHNTNQNSDYKDYIVKGFSAQQLEQMLQRTSKTSASELINNLVSPVSSGILQELLSWVQTTSVHKLQFQEPESDINFKQSQNSRNLIQSSRSNRRLRESSYQRRPLTSRKIIAVNYTRTVYDRSMSNRRTYRYNKNNMSQFNFPKPFQVSPGQPDYQTKPNTVEQNADEFAPVLIPNTVHEYPPIIVPETTQNSMFQQAPYQSQPQTTAMKAQFATRGAEDEQEAAVKMQVLIDRLKDYRDKLNQLKNQNMETAKISWERQQRIKELESEKEQFEKELEFLGLDGKGDNYNIVARDAMADEEAKRKMDMRREMMMGIALVGGDHQDFLGKEERDKNCFDKLIDYIAAFFNKFTVLKADLKRIENKYDKSISSYFSFFKFLVNVGLAMLLVYGYLLVSHIILFDDGIIDTCSGNLCVTLYYGFDRDDEQLAYSITLIALIVITLLQTGSKYIQSMAYRQRALIYGGKDAKLKKFSAIAFNSWDWSTVGEVDTSDSRENLANIIKIALSDDARMAEAANRTREQKTALLMRRIFSGFLFLIILGMGWVAITILMITEKDFLDLFDSGYETFIKLIPKLGISIMNAGIPKISYILISIEKWDDPAFSVKINLIRIYLIKIANVILFALLNLELATESSWYGDEEGRIAFESDYYNCREDQAGVNLALLIISEAFISKIVPLLAHGFDKLIAKMRKKQFVKEEIKVAQQVIEVIYFQGLIWIALPYYPYSAFLAPILLFLDFKFQYWRLRSLQQKPSQMTQASDIVLIIMRLYTATFALALAYFVYFLTQPVQHNFYSTDKLCGPFFADEKANAPVIDFMESNVVLSQIWDYFLDLAPVLWILAVVLASKSAGQSTLIRIYKNYIKDMEEEKSFQIEELQRANARLRTQIQLNRKIM